MSAVNVLREYGQAIRGDWGDLDGRSVEFVINDFATWIDSPDTYPGDEEARRDTGICVAGGGHWCGRWGHCSDDCGCPDHEATS